MPDIDDVVASIRQLEEKRRDVADELSGLGDQALEAPPLVEQQLVHTVDAAQLDGRTIAGVDGGLVKRGFHGVDVVLSRAVAALFTYRGETVTSSNYIPERTPRPDIIHLDSPLDRHEFDVSSSLLRLQKEVQAAIDAVEQEPDAVLLDGSIVPQYMDRPAEGTKPREFYDELIQSYRELFQTALDYGVTLAGVIEDSRGTGLCDVLASQTFMAEEMEYTEEYEKHPTLRDIGDVSDRVHNFYLRTAENDRPVRVDFLAGEDTVASADRAASLILPLCSYSSTYGIPSVIVEADRCAKFSEKDVEMFESRLRSVMDAFPGLGDLRRDSRPF
ncbi:MAG: DNA double-strand break repair nuclease NurA [Candidatus Nanohaloarchaea archaeon]|nr:DNA double-strand break repair nuclease NurA [Candidatus Nanohaloarchaea archaeon]